jgi:hypothetical protein
MPPTRHAILTVRYTFVPTFYGSTYSDYMGVGLAYPTGRFKELGLDIKRVSEVAKPPRGPRRSRAAAADATWSEWVAQKGGQVHKAYMALMGKSPQKPTQTHWEAARYRYNRMVCCLVGFGVVLQCVHPL